MKRIIKLCAVIIILLIILFAFLIGLIIKYGYGVSQQGNIYVVKNTEYTGLSEQERFITDFDFLYNELKENYVLFDYKEQVLGLDLEKEYQSYRKKIEMVNDERKFYALCSEFVRLFDDDHMDFACYSRETRQKIRSVINSDYTVLFDYRVIEGKPIIISAHRDFDAPGWEIISINDIPFREIEAVMKKTLHKQRIKGGEILQYFSLYKETIPEKLEILLKNRNNEEKYIEIDFSRRYEPLLERGTPDINFGHYQNDQLPQARTIDEKIGYILIPSFSPPPRVMRETFKKIVEDFENIGIKGLIIDIRYNGGGNESFRDILGYLTSEEIVICNFRYKKTERFQDIFYLRHLYESLRFKTSRKAEKGYTDWWAWTIKPADNQFLTTIPVVLLANDYTFSSADSFVGACLEYDLAHVLANSVRLSGGGLPVRVFLPSRNYYVSYGVWEGWSSDLSHLIEGRKLEPDIRVEQTLEDYFQGIDTYLKTALDYLDKIILETEGI